MVTLNQNIQTMRMIDFTLHTKKKQQVQTTIAAIVAGKTAYLNKQLIDGVFLYRDPNKSCLWLKKGKEMIFVFLLPL